MPEATAAFQSRLLRSDAQPCARPAEAPASFCTGRLTAKLTARTAWSTASTASTALSVASPILSSSAFIRSTEPPALLITGRISRSVPRISDVSRVKRARDRQQRPTERESDRDEEDGEREVGDVTG